MITNKSISEDPRYKEQIRKLSNEGLKIITENRTKALEYAKKGIEITEPEKLTAEYVEFIASGMQILARTILKERDKKT